jgi:hypothetical protein
MNTDEGRCAKCGKNLPYNFASHDWNRKEAGGPYFCSQRCYESILPAIPDFDDEEYDRLVSSREREPPPDLSWQEDLRFSVRENFRVKRELREQAERDQQEAFKEFAYHWSRQRDHDMRQAELKAAEKRREEDEKEQRKLEEQLLKEERAAFAAHQKREEAEERRWNQQWEKDYDRRLQEEEKLREEEAKRQDPVPIPMKARFEHTHILAPPGTGKTTLMQEIILDDLYSDNPPAIVVVDPKGQMVKRLRTLELFTPYTKGLHDRLIILDATDIEALPALNMFHTPETGSPAVRQRIRNQLIELLEYIFSSSDFKLTQKQSIGFSFLAQLMFEIPGANIRTFFDVIDEEVKKGERSKYASYMEQLDDGAQLFFQKDFYGEFSETKSQIKSRLYLILRNPALSAMFNAPTCTINWFECIQKRKIILVNTGLNQLGQGASQLFGRYVIASVSAAAFAREAIPNQNDWTPAFLHIDEAQLFVDEKRTQYMLNLLREYKLGITLAHQQMTGEPFNDNIRNTLSTSTAVKYAASVEAADLGQAARDLRCEPEFIRQHQRDDTHVHFATYVRNLRLKGAFTTSVPIGNVETGQHMSDESLEVLLEHNRCLVTGRPTPDTPRPELAVPYLNYKEEFIETYAVLSGRGREFALKTWMDVTGDTVADVAVFSPKNSAVKPQPEKVVPPPKEDPPQLSNDDWA